MEKKELVELIRNCETPYDEIEINGYKVRIRALNNPSEEALINLNKRYSELYDQIKI